MPWLPSIFLDSHNSRYKKYNPKFIMTLWYDRQRHQMICEKVKRPENKYEAASTLWETDRLGKSIYCGRYLAWKWKRVTTMMIRIMGQGGVAKIMKTNMVIDGSRDERVSGCISSNLSLIIVFSSGDGSLLCFVSVSFFCWRHWKL